MPRVFFALWPDADTARRLAALAGRLRDEFGGRATRGETVHLTLAFVGEVPAEALAGLRQVGATVAAEFAPPAQERRFALDRVGFWPHKRIAWAGPAEPPAALAELAGRLLAALRARGHCLDRQGFVPHLTLVRRVRDRPEAAALAAHAAALAGAEWQWDGFRLVRSRLSEKGASYETVDEWTLPAPR